MPLLPQSFCPPSPPFFQLWTYPTTTLPTTSLPTAVASHTVHALVGPAFTGAGNTYFTYLHLPRDIFVVSSLTSSGLTYRITISLQVMPTVILALIARAIHLCSLLSCRCHLAVYTLFSLIPRRVACNLLPSPGLAMASLRQQARTFGPLLRGGRPL